MPSEDKTLRYALYIEQIEGNSFDSFITLNGKRIGGGMGGLREILGSAVARMLNSFADGEFYDPFIPENEVVLYPPGEKPPKYRINPAKVLEMPSREIDPQAPAAIYETEKSSSNS